MHSEYSVLDNSRQGEYDKSEDEYVDNPTTGEYDNLLYDFSNPSDNVGESYVFGLAGERDEVCLRTGDSGEDGRRNGICQLDGNESVGESDLESVSEEVVESEDEASAQDPPPWHEPYTREDEPRTKVLRRINTNNRVAISAEMPTIAATNTRSIFPKFRHFAEDIIQRQITACFVSEIWQKENNVKFQKEVERMFELNGLQFISCPRAQNRSGGGAAIVVNTEKFFCEKLNVMVPGKLECVWAMLRPKNITKETKFKGYILCGFYSPPKSRKNAKLLDHMISTLHMLMTKYPDCGWVAGGDRNQFPLAPLLAALPNSRQLVTQITYKKTGKIYDVLITNMGQFYQIPYICPAVQVDEPSSGAVPSDHDCAVAEPLAGAGGGSTREYTVRTSQPFPQSGLAEFGAWLHTVRWDAELTDDCSSTEMALRLEERLRDKVKDVFPIKSVRVSNEDKPFFSAELKKLDRYVKKEYRQKGKSTKYLRLKTAYDSKYRKAAAFYIKVHFAMLKCLPVHFLEKSTHLLTLRKSVTCKAP